MTRLVSSLMQNNCWINSSGTHLPQIEIKYIEYNKSTMGKKTSAYNQEVSDKKWAPQNAADNLRSKIKKDGKKPKVGKKLKGSNLASTTHLTIANSAPFHSQIIYSFDGTLLHFDSIKNSSGTIDVSTNPFLKSGLSLLIDTSAIQISGSIGTVTSQFRDNSPDIDYFYIYLKANQTTGNYEYLGLGSQNGSGPNGWEIKIAHDDFVFDNSNDVYAFKTADLASTTSAATQNLTFSPTIGSITNFFNQTRDQMGNYVIKTFGNPK